MKSRESGKWKCPACEEWETVYFDLPKLMKPFFHGHVCKMCRSRFLLKFIRVQKSKQKGSHVDVQSKLLELSPMGKQLQMGDA